MLSYFGSQVGVDEVVSALNAEGAAIVKNLLTPDVVARIRSEIDPKLPSAFLGQDTFTGIRTRRLGGLTVKSPTFARLLTHPLMLGVCDRLLQPHCSLYQLAATQAIEIGAGEPAQALHRDDIIYSKPARNSGGNAPAAFIDELLNMGEGPVMTIVVKKKDLIEPHAGDDKRAGPCQAFGGASFEFAGLDNPLKEQLDGFTAIGKQLPLPGLGVLGQLLGGKQPAAVLGIERDEVSAAERRISQQELRLRQLFRPQGRIQAG